jgi:hypothetical protein
MDQGMQGNIRKHKLRVGDDVFVKVSGIKPGPFTTERITYIRTEDGQMWHGFVNTKDILDRGATAYVKAILLTNYKNGKDVLTVNRRFLIHPIGEYTSIDRTLLLHRDEFKLPTEFKGDSVE